MSLMKQCNHILNAALKLQGPVINYVVVYVWALLLRMESSQQYVLCEAILFQSTASERSGRSRGKCYWTITPHLAPLRWHMVSREGTFSPEGIF